MFELDLSSQQPMSFEADRDATMPFASDAFDVSFFQALQQVRQFADAEFSQYTEPVPEFTLAATTLATSASSPQVDELIGGDAFSEVAWQDDVIGQQTQAPLWLSEPGSSPFTARDLGILNGSVSQNGWVGGFNREDVYRFQIDTASDLKLSLSSNFYSGLFNDADIELFQDLNGDNWLDSYEWLDGSYNPGSDSETISSIGLEPGTYFVRVNSFSGLTSYNLSLESLPATLALARDVGFLGHQHLVDSVSSSDPGDVYRFSVAVDSDLSLTLDGFSADASISLIRDRDNDGVAEAGELLMTATSSAQLPEEIAYLGLEAGTYFVRVREENGDIAYGLTLSAVPSSGEFNSSYGHGLVDAAAAVAAAIGSPVPFPEVPSAGWADIERDLVNAPEVWSQGITGAGIVVAVVDTGVDFTHSDLDNNIWQNWDEIPYNGIDDDRNGYTDDFRGWDFVSGDNNPMDFSGHGTHVAGAIAAESNGWGITGVAPGAQIMPVRVLGYNGGTPANIAAGIRYAVDNGADVINLSLGVASVLVEEAIQYAAERGAVVVMAAGNDGNNAPDAPANLAIAHGIAVGAVDMDGIVAGFSNRAGSVPMDFVVAPGVDVYSTVPWERYDFDNGTSMATPHVAGVAALMLSVNPSLTAAEVEQLIATTANPIAAIA